MDNQILVTSIPRKPKQEPAPVQVTQSVLLGAAFAALLVIIGASALAVWRNATVAQDRIAALQAAHTDAAAALMSIRTSVYLNGILVRDYLLDADPQHAQQYIDQFAEINARLNENFRTLESLGGNPQQREALAQLRTELAAHLDPTEVMLDWSPAEKQAQRTAMLRQRLRRREEVFGLAEQVEKLTTANYAREQERVKTADREFRSSLGWTTGSALLLGFVIAGATFLRMLRLESQSALAASELRRLSTQLRTTQEQERKSLARELHDQVGQMLTGLKMELATIAKMHGDSNSEISFRIANAKGVAEQTLRIVRNIAMLLRPSMLDDLGLTPALTWLIKEISKSSGLDIRSDIDPEVDGLPDAYSTCIFRVVQEALTNAARHSKAAKVQVSLSLDRDLVKGAIVDDGSGFDPDSVKGKGSGLSSMSERIKELNGTVLLTAAPGRGVRIEFALPRPSISTEVYDDAHTDSRRSRDSAGGAETSA
jgi:signal transduction histidine kinase